MSRLVTYQFVIALWRAKTAEFAAAKYWEIIVNKIIKAGWSWGCISRWIPTGARSGLLTHIAETESDSLCERMKS